MTDSMSAAIVAATAAALNPSPDICGCPDTVAMLAAPAVLRAAANLYFCEEDGAALLRWADQIDDRALGITSPRPSAGDHQGTHHG